MFQKDGLIRLVYNLLFFVFFLVSAPFYFWKMWRRGGWRSGFGQRFGFYDALVRNRFGDRPTGWLHAVSVGEVNLCLPLLEKLRERMPEHQWVVTTTTSTGMAELRRKTPETPAVYYPIDLWFVVRRALKTLRPSMIVLIEAELWPNLLWQAGDVGIPVVLANARLSDSSFRGYLRAQFLFRQHFQSLAAVGAQCESDVRRWMQLGCPPERIHVTGNLKFASVVTLAPGRVDARGLLSSMGVPAGAKIIVGGSTHTGEERILGEVFQSLKRELRKPLFLIVVPRHMERGKVAEQDLLSSGCKVLRRSRLKPETPETDSLLVDTTGELLDFYAIADVVFVGKSLCARGGQNPLEPVGLGKPVVFGPNMGNFRDIVRQLLAAGAARQVADQLELGRELSQILNHQSESSALVAAGQTVLEKNRGTLEKTVGIVCCGDEKNPSKTT